MTTTAAAANIFRTVEITTDGGLVATTTRVADFEIEMEPMFTMRDDIDRDNMQDMHVLLMLGDIDRANEVGSQIGLTARYTD